jgi:hypothetical protein
MRSLLNNNYAGELHPNPGQSCNVNSLEMEIENCK